MVATRVTKARLLDPATGLGWPGALLVRDGVITDHGADLGTHDGAPVVDAAGARLGEPGTEDYETIASAAHAAVARRITTPFALSDTDPPHVPARNLRRTS